MENPISTYNFGVGMVEVEKLLLKDKRIRNVGRGKYCVSLNEVDDKKPFLIKNQYGFKVKFDGLLSFSKDGVWQLKKDEFITPFDIYTQSDCKGNVLLAVHLLNNRFLKKKPNYIRAGTDYFKKVSIVDRDSIDRTDLKRWKKETIKDDYGNGFFDLIPKYDGFGIFPDNKNYKESQHGLYNQYSPFAHTPSKLDVTEKDITWSMNLIKHIFGEQWELGLKYMKVIYEMPKQILPILSLVSKERETGKSTYGDWLNILFGDNACVINPINISSAFNSSYATKNIIIIEETKIDKSADLEKIKTIATQKKITVNTKFMPEYSIPFYGKVVMFSNHEDKFVKIDEEENRYWVLKVPTLKGKANHSILEDLTNEVPAFLKFLDQLEDVDTSKSRMVFTQEEINTNILDSTKKNSRSGAYKDVEIYLEKEMMENTHKEYIYFRHEDLHEKYFQRGSNYSISYIREVLRNEMHLKMEHRTSEPLISENVREHQTRAFRVENTYYQNAGERIVEEDCPY